MKLPASSITKIDTELAEEKKRILQGILPPEYIAQKDGPDGRPVIDPNDSRN